SRSLRSARKDGEGEATQARRVISPLHQSSMAGLVPAIGVLQDRRPQVNARDAVRAWRGSRRSVMASLQQRTEVRDGMRIDFDVPITMDDGVVLRADVFRPLHEGKFPVILSYGPYAKNLAFQDGYPSAWQRMTEKHP